MQKIARTALLFIAILLVSLALQWQTGFSQTQTFGETERYYSATGHHLSGNFLVFYDEFPNADTLIGFPITESFINPTTNEKMQFFSRGVLIEQNGVVRRLRLGLFLEKGEPPSHASPTSNNCQTFNGFQVCGYFLEYYLQHGGPAVFGFPVSDVLIFDLHQMQYFEFARFEWHPQNGDYTLPLKLGELGHEYFLQQRYDPIRLLPVQNSEVATIQETNTTKMTVYAFMAEPVVTLGEQAHLYLIVQSKNGLPLEGQTGTVTIQFGEQTLIKQMIPQTNELGITSFLINTGSLLGEENQSYLGTVTLEIEIDSGIYPAVTRISFRTLP